MFWWDNFSVLLDLPTLWNFIPTPDMSLPEKLNAVTRFAMYYSILLILVKQSFHYAYIFIFVALCTVAVYHTERSKESYDMQLHDRLNIRNVPYQDNRFAYKPTKHNPFMNVTMGDLEQFPRRPAAANIRAPNIRTEISELFDKSFPRDDLDLYGARSSDRQFYTMPVTTIPNDQRSFADWLYKNPQKTHKESHLAYGQKAPSSVLV